MMNTGGVYGDYCSSSGVDRRSNSGRNNEADLEYRADKRGQIWANLRLIFLLLPSYLAAVVLQTYAYWC